MKLREFFGKFFFILILKNYEELGLPIDYTRCLGSSIHAKIVNFDNFEFFCVFLMVFDVSPSNFSIKNWFGLVFEHRI